MCVCTFLVSLFFAKKIIAKFRTIFESEKNNPYICFCVQIFV